jgi:8-oxo-dGTP diphosphatase
MSQWVSQSYGGRVRLRAAGVLIENDEILLVKMLGLGKEGVFWAPPGGGIEFGESIAAGLIREFKEETGLEVEVGLLVCVHEYIEPPLHAVELFYSVRRVGGQLTLGKDPETEKQLIAELCFLSKQQVLKIPTSQRHPKLDFFLSEMA